MHMNMKFVPVLSDNSDRSVTCPNFNFFAFSVVPDGRTKLKVEPCQESTISVEFELQLRRFATAVEKLHICSTHDDVIKGKHFSHYWPFVRGINWSPENSPHKGQWRGALIFSLICSWINGWVNNGETGDLRRYHAHYDVTVMRDHFVYAPSKWEMMLYCNVVSHWLGTYT